MECQYTNPNIIALQSTRMDVSLNLSCLFVHKPLHQTTVVHCNRIFRRRSLHMDHRTVLHIRVGSLWLAPTIAAIHCEHCTH